MTGSIFDLDEFKPYYSRFLARVQELSRRRGYYDGSIYRQGRERLGWLGPRLYKGVKSLYLPLARAVDVDAGIIPGGWATAPDTPEAAQAAMRQVLAWSHWQTDGVLYVHYGAMYGVSALKVADLRGREQVVITPVDPTCLLLVPGNQYDETPAMAIWVQTRSNERGEQYEYAEVITPDTVRTFAAGQPAEIDGRAAEYANALGFVPYVEIRHIETGDPLGECTFQKAMPLLDEVNQLASYLADIIKKHAEPQWAIIGAEPGELEHSGANAWFIPAGGDAKILVPNIDIDGVLEFVREIRNGVHGALPELAFDELKSKTQIATATVELQLMELVLKIKRTRPNYDHGLVHALRMAGRAATTMQHISQIALLDDDGLRLDAERMILPVSERTG